MTNGKERDAMEDAAVDEDGVLQIRRRTPEARDEYLTRRAIELTTQVRQLTLQLEDATARRRYVEEERDAALKAAAERVRLTPAWLSFAIWLMVCASAVAITWVIAR